MKTWIWAVGLALGLSLTAASAFAAPVTWTVAGVYEDGGTVSGTFTYDVDTNTYSAINIVTAGGALPPSTYISLHGSVAVFSSNVTLVTSAGRVEFAPVLSLSFMPIGNGGGTLALLGNTAEGICNFGCQGFSGASRALSSGTVTTSPPPATVPTMSEWALILLGVMLAGGAALTIQRRKTA